MEREESVKKVSKLMPSLLQAGCLGDNRALHLASVLYSSGLGVKKQLYKVCSFGAKIYQKMFLHLTPILVCVCGLGVVCVWFPGLATISVGSSEGLEAGSSPAGTPSPCRR